MFHLQTERWFVAELMMMAVMFGIVTVEALFGGGVLSRLLYFYSITFF